MISVNELEGRFAYDQAMQNLKPTWDRPFTPRQYPGRYFHYGEDGRGLVLSHGLVYVSSDSAEEIRAIDGPIVIGKGLYLESPQFRILDGVLSPDAIVDVVSFTRQVGEKALTRPRVRQKRSSR